MRRKYKFLFRRFNGFTFRRGDHLTWTLNKLICCKHVQRFKKFHAMCSVMAFVLSVANDMSFTACFRAVASWKLGRNTLIPGLGPTRIFSAPPGICKGVISTDATTVSFHILANVLFTNHPVTRH